MAIPMTMFRAFVDELTKIASTKEAMHWTKDLDRDIMNGRKYPGSYLTGELKELGEAIKERNWNHIKEEAGDSAYAAQMIVGQRTGLNLPVVGADRVIKKFYDRIGTWKKAFKEQDVPFSHDYLAGGSNYAKPEKVQAAFALANHHLSDDEARRISQSLVGKVKTSTVVAHIDGPMGSGKTTLIRKIGKDFPGLVVKDVDEFKRDAAHIVRLELGDRPQNAGPKDDELFKQKVMAMRQKLTDDFLEKHKDRPVVLAGMKVGLSKFPFEFPEEGQAKYRLDDVGPLRSTYRAYKRNLDLDKPRRWPLSDTPRRYREAREHIKLLDSMGYRPASSKAIIEELGKVKTSALSKAQAQERVDMHHQTRDWNLFEKNLKAKAFRQAVVSHPESDAKLKRYTKNFGEYTSSKKVLGVVPSRTSNKLYKIKELSNGRLACGCGDWQYLHSHKKTDCDHIKEFKGGLS